MSQIFADTSASPSVPTTFTTDSGNAVPVANVLNIVADDSIVYNAAGISTQGSGNTVTVLLNNRVQGTGTTAGAVTDDLVTFDCGGTAGVYRFQLNVVGFDSGSVDGCGFGVTATVRTTGAAATLIDEDVTTQRETALTDATVVVSGNDAIVRVTGAATYTHSWSVSGYFEEVQ